MSSFLAEVSSQMKAIWARLDSGQRMTVASVMFATIVGLGAILWYSSRPDYRSLKNFSDPQAMVEAEAALTGRGIPFVAKGSEIQVDSDDYDDAWSLLFKAELTGSDTDLSSAPISNLVPDRDTRLQMINDENRRKAERAVRTLDAIASVGVTASKPKPSPFQSLDDLYAPSATATISLRPGADFAKVASSVASVVASAVGFHKQFVEVIDTKTNRKYQFDPEGASGANMNDFLAQEESRSVALTRKVQGVLDLVFPGKTKVTVTVKLDNVWETTQETIVPDEPVVKSDSTTKSVSETLRVASGASEGQQTTQTSVPTSKDKNDSRDRQFLTDLGVRRRGKLAPDIVRITCSIFVDDNDASLAGRKEEIRDHVMQITGMQNRQDIIVTGFPFPELEPMPAPVGPEFMDTVKEWAPIVGQVLGVLMVLLFLRGMLKRAASVTGTPRATGVGDVEDELDPKAASRQIRREIEKTISEDPAAISRLLESWLDEQKV